MPVISLQSYRIWLSAVHARSRTTEGSFDAIVAIMLSAAAAEAFINEVPASLQFSGPELSPQLQALRDALLEIEANRGTLILKYLVTGHVFGRPYARGVNPLQDFSTLITLRNDVMHVKQKDGSVISELADGVTKETIVWPKHVTALHQRGLLSSDPDPRLRMSSFDALQTPRLAEWACQVSEAMVDSVIAMFPKDHPPHGSDPLGIIKSGWPGTPGSRMERVLGALEQFRKSAVTERQ